METIEVEDFSLEHTIKSGQFFTFEKIDEFYHILHKNKVFKVSQRGNTLYFKNIKKEELIDFFNLDLNLREETIDFKDKYLLLSLEKYWGLRIIKQDLWECMIGFVCSSASNIPKIKMNLKLISEFFGEEVIFENRTYHIFPKAGQIDNYQKLIDSKTGYRAKYIYRINEMIKEDQTLLDKIKNANYKNAKELLMQFPGIGPKVADCICLYSLGHKEAFPIDTWIKQILEELYYEKQTQTIKELERFIEDHFDNNRGLKQQYLFHYARLNLKQSKKNLFEDTD